MKQAGIKRSIRKPLLTAAMLLALVLGMQLTASAAGDQRIEEQSDWLAVQPLDEDGATLTIATTESPTDSTEIKVTAPEGSAVTIIGQENVTYHNVQIFVLSDDITLQLVNLNIAAPDVDSALNMPGISIRGGADSATIHVTGSCSVRGGNTTVTNGAGGGVGIDATFQDNKRITIEGPGTLNVTGGNGGDVNGGYAIDCGDLIINAPTTVQGGGNTADDDGYSGGSGLYVRGNLTVNAKLKATGGDAPNYIYKYSAGIDCMRDITINAEVIARGGTGYAGSYGMISNLGRFTITENGSLTVYGGEGLTTVGGASFFGNGSPPVEINGDFTAIGGKGKTKGGDGVYSAHTSFAFTGGTSVIQGGQGETSDGGHGILLTNAANLEINGADVTATGADSATSAASGHGVSVSGDIAIIGGSLTAQGGSNTASGNSGNGIYATGSLTISGGTVKAYGGDGGNEANPHGSGIYHSSTTDWSISGGTVYAQGGDGGSSHGIYSDEYPNNSSLAITGGEVTAVGGGANGTRHSHGIKIYGDLIIENATLTAHGQYNGSYGIFVALGTLEVGDGANVTATGTASGTDEDGYGIFTSTATFKITGGEVTASGGDSSSASYAAGDGIYTSDGSFKMTGGIVRTSGGGSTGYNGGRGLYLDSGDVLISGGTLIAKGGDGQGFGGHGVIAMSGDITIENGANVTALGGTGINSSGGVGLRAIYQFYNTSDPENSYWENLGKTVTIANDAGNVYVLGGLGAGNERRPSIMADIVYIATGSVGEIAFEEDAVNQLIKNTAGGDDVHMLTVIAHPAAAIDITSEVSAITGYTYLAPAAGDGTVYMWLPLGTQTVSSRAYGSASGTVVNTNDAVVYLNDAVAPLLTNSSSNRASSEAATIKFTSSEAGSYYYIVSNSSAAAPAEADIQASANSLAMQSGENTLSITDLSDSGAKTIYIMGADAAGNWSAVLPIDIPYYDSGSSSSSSGGGTTRYTIKFESNGGSTVSSQSVARNAKVTEPAAPTRNGYAFTGWYTDAALSEKYDFTKAVTASFTLYAGWEIAAENPGEDETFDYPAYISGYADGTFRPGSSLTRAEAASLFYGLIDSNISAGSYTTAFSDIETGAWYYNSVMELARRGIISGYSDGSFRPNATITRAEFVAMALRFADVSGESKAAGFSDVAQSHWAADLISAAVSAGYVSGYPDGSFRPEATVSRAEAVTILNRITGRSGLASGTSFSDVPQSYWAYEAITSAATNHN